MQVAFLVETLCPQINDITILPKKLSAAQQAQITKNYDNRSLRELSKEHGVSHETVRRTLKKDLRFVHSIVNVAKQAFVTPDKVPLLIDTLATGNLSSILQISKRR